MFPHLVSKLILLIICLKTAAYKNVYNDNEYNQHVTNTRADRSAQWSNDISELRTLLVRNFNLLNHKSKSSFSAYNNNDAPDDKKVRYIKGDHVINLNHGIVPDVQTDMENRCKELYTKTQVRFLYLTASVNYYIPSDSLDLFMNGVAKAIESVHSDKKLVIAIWLKLQDRSTGVPDHVLLLKQNCGQLSSAQTGLASYKITGNYQSGALYKFNLLYGMLSGESAR